MNEVSIDSRVTGENERRILQRERQPHLFRPLRLRSVTSRNRIMLSPMCQYSAENGVATNWHLIHLGARATGGAGIVATEAVHIEPRGRITPFCLGLWNDDQQRQLAVISEFIAAAGAVPAIQLGHAGRKASVGRPWEGTKPLSLADGGWGVISASDRPYAAGWPQPHALTQSEIDTLMEQLAAATRRAREAGFQLLELHGAHGYLIHQFLSPLSNVRSDAYGGAFTNRIRFLMESIAAARSEWPPELPLFLRLSVTDWVAGGWSIDDSLRLAKLLHDAGDVDLIDCSSGGNDPRQSIPIHPGYQIPFAAAVKQSSGMPTAAVGLIHSADLAESTIANGAADLVVLGRALLADPTWPLRAARHLQTAGPWPVQYERSNIF